MEQASQQIHVEPGETKNLALSHSGIDRHRDNSLYPFLIFKFLEQPGFFVEGQITCPSPAGIAINQVRVKG